MTAKGTIVVSGAPATGKSTVAAAVADSFDFPLLSLDMVKETLADVLGIKEEQEEAWSYTLGDAAAEVVFRLGDMFPCAVVEGWWRGDRRKRAEERFVGCVEIFCRCKPSLAERRMRARLGTTGIRSIVTWSIPRSSSRPHDWPTRFLPSALGQL